ncbi:ABC transporter substrate-binding protein [Nonomuraea sp. NPDC026600]|uniref:ABC transporter substrate-binding protein n=1 Tax=Nonomuraea sp. NPDC026600 TaxID=3155363 RepID=UPI0033E23E76
MKRLLLATLSALCVLTGCAVPTATTATAPAGVCSSSHTTASPTPTPAAGLTEINVDYLPIPDSAPLHIAKACGFFTAEGLKANTTEIPAADAALPGMTSGKVQFSLFNYVTAFYTHQRQPNLIKLVADAYQAEPGAFLLMARKDSPFKSLATLKQDLHGRQIRIGVASTASVPTLTTEITLKIAGLTKDDIKFVRIPLPEMPAAVERGSVHLGWEVEPFITRHRSTAGAIMLADVCNGPTAQFPIAGWAVAGAWAAKNPSLVIRFQRALARAQEIAAVDRGAVTKILPTYTHGITAAIASQIQLGTYPTTLNTTRVQRVGDAMVGAGYLTRSIDAHDLIWQAPSTTPSTAASAGVTP